MALTAIVPYVGAVVGAIPALITALLVSPATALATVVLFLAVQALESNVLTPCVQGTALNVHPILVLLAVIGGGQAAGIGGPCSPSPPSPPSRSFMTSFALASAWSDAMKSHQTLSRNSHA